MADAGPVVAPTLTPRRHPRSKSPRSKLSSSSRKKDHGASAHRSSSASSTSSESSSSLASEAGGGGLVESLTSLLGRLRDYTSLRRTWKSLRKNRLTYTTLSFLALLAYLVSGSLTQSRLGQTVAQETREYLSNVGGLGTRVQHDVREAYDKSKEAASEQSRGFSDYLHRQPREAFERTKEMAADAKEGLASSYEKSKDFFTPPSALECAKLRVENGVLYHDNTMAPTSDVAKLLVCNASAFAEMAQSGSRSAYEKLREDYESLKEKVTSTVPLSKTYESLKADLDALAAKVASLPQALPGRDSLPTMPGRESLPNMPGREDLPNMPGREDLPSMPGREDLPSMPGRDSLPHMPELPDGAALLKRLTELETRLSEQLASGVSSVMKGGASEEIWLKLSQELERLRSMVEEDDGVSRPDLALATAGATVLKEHTSRSWWPNVTDDATSMVAPIRWLKNALGGLVLNGPETAITPDMHPGSCWPCQLGECRLGVKLAPTPKRSAVRAVSLSHVPKRLLTHDEFDSAPKQFRVTLKSSSGNVSDVWQEFTYDRSATAARTQTFELDRPVPADAVVLEVLSAHGHPRAACVYRFRVHPNTTDVA